MHRFVWAKAKGLYGDSLYRNSFYLMASTAVMAVFGFFFWMINARLFTPDQVGIGTTLISVMALISSLSFLGLGNGLIKYLPTSERKNDKINTAFTLVGLASILIAAVYLMFINIFSPKLLFIRENLLFSGLFIVFIAFSTLNNAADSVFIANRSSLYILIKNTVFSLVKLILPFLLVTLGAYGIFMVIGIDLVIAFGLGLGFLIFKFKYVFRPAINLDIVKRMTKFSLGTYTAGIIGALPSMVLPILITNMIGAKFSAYFYMDMMIANILYIIPLAVSQSLFAEGSYTEADLKTHLKKAIKIISLLIIPATLIIVLFGKYILLAFGKQYSEEGIILLQLLAASSIFVSINSIGNSLLYIRHKIKLMIVVNLTGAAAIMSLAALMANLNLVGVGIGWIIGQAILATIFLYILRNTFRL